MIVICTKCQAKFRVADDKIGPRGAKVRCSRCQAIFLVHPDLGTMPTPDPSQDAAVAVPLRPAKPPVPPAPQLPPPLPTFAAAPPPAEPAPDPFAGFAARAPEPLAATDPFAARGSAATPRASLPVTDLSDLLGPAARADPFAAVPAAALPLHEPPVPADDVGIALEERLTPPPMKAALLSEPEPALEIGAAPTFDAGPSADPFAAAPGQPFDPSSYAYAGDAREEPLALAGGEPARALPGPPEPAAAPAPAWGAGPPAPAAAARPPSPHPAGRAALPRTSRLRAVVVNALALAALLLVALAILVVWRTEGPLEPGALRPAAILAAVRGGGAASGPFAAIDVRSGVYERARGAPLLFVRGKVVSRSAAPVAAVKVSVAVVRAGEVLVRGDGIAGAVPTAEELHGATDRAALVRALAAARGRAPAAVKPGDAVPFLVALGDAPSDLDGAAIRVEVAPAAGRIP